MHLVLYPCARAHIAHVYNKICTHRYHYHYKLYLLCVHVLHGCVCHVLQYILKTLRFYVPVIYIFLYFFAHFFLLLFVIFFLLFFLVIVIFSASTSSIVHYFYKNKCLGIEQQKRRRQARNNKKKNEKKRKRKTVHKNCNHPPCAICFFSVCPLNILSSSSLRSPSSSFLTALCVCICTRYRISFASFFASYLVCRVCIAHSPNSACIPRAPKPMPGLCVCVCVRPKVTPLIPIPPQLHSNRVYEYIYI